MTLLVLVALLAVAAWFGWRSVLDVRTPEAVEVCTTPSPDTKQTIASRSVTVNVYNAGRVLGMADRTSEQLSNRGFVVEDVGNDEDDTKVDNVIVRGRAKNAPEVLLVAAQLAGEDLVADNRADSTVDVIIGDEFKGLQPKAARSINVNSPVPMCTTSTPTPE